MKTDAIPAMCLAPTTSIGGHTVQKPYCGAGFSWGCSCSHCQTLFYWCHSLWFLSDLYLFNSSFYKHLILGLTEKKNPGFAPCYIICPNGSTSQSQQIISSLDYTHKLAPEINKLLLLFTIRQIPQQQTSRYSSATFCTKSYQRGIFILSTKQLSIKKQEKQQLWYDLTLQAHIIHSLITLSRILDIAECS